MICTNCNGIGYVENGHRNHVSESVAWEREYTNPIRCKACGGSGFILSNADEVMNMIDIHINNKTSLTQRELKRLKMMLKK